MTVPPFIQLVQQTGSTNADVVAAIRAGDGWADGRWLVTRRQTVGRGRQGRAWFDGAGNFMGSTAVVTTADGPPPASVSFVAALAVRDACAAALGEDERLALKWPNDVLFSGGKLSGILLEMVRGNIVVGIGVNLAHAPELPDRKTAALHDVMSPPDAEDFAVSLADHFARRLHLWRTGGIEATLQAFLAASIHTVGSPVTVHDTDGSALTGLFTGLEKSDGALRLRLADGSERVIRAGDIS